MTYETILYEKKARIAYVTLNRPRILNAYNDTMGDELLQAQRDFDQDDDLHVLIISGAGRAFCSGADVKQRQLRPLEEMKRLGGPAGGIRPAGGLLGLVHLHRSSYAIESPVVYLDDETTSLYSTFDR